VVGGLVSYRLNSREKDKEVKDIKVLIQDSDFVGWPARLVTVFDNYQFDPSLKTGWGFSCLVKVGEQWILFDTGADSLILLANMEKLKIDPAKIDIIVLSHIHDDHVGGLFGVLEENSKIQVFLPVSFPKNFKDKIKSYGSKAVEVKESAKIADGVYSTGELGTWIKEQSLIVETTQGLVIITGCAHPGIVRIVEKTKEMFEKEVYLVLGGFHLGGASDSQLKNIIASFRDLGVQKVAPCHCSGKRCRELFKQEYGQDYLENGVGRVIDI